MKIRFQIPGQPHAKQRTRSVIWMRCRDCGKKTMRRQCMCGSIDLEVLHSSDFTPGPTKTYENHVKACAWAAMQEAAKENGGDVTLWEGPLSLVVLAWFEIPASMKCSLPSGHLSRANTPCRKRHESDPHTQSPDITNVVKSVEDGCNQVIWHDDRQLVEVISKKYWGEMPRVEVSVESV